MIQRERALRLFDQKTISEPNSGCKIWLGATTAYGYGAITDEITPGCFTNRPAHRVAYETFVGAIPDGLCICHRCDNPPCCNPDHLFLGTRGENNTDRRRKNRDPDRRGEKNPRAKLTPEQVIAIRNAPGSGASIARQYGVAQQLVSRIKAGGVWGHL
jgi:hypothetical protein